MYFDSITNTNLRLGVVFFETVGDQREKTVGGVVCVTQYGCCPVYIMTRLCKKKYIRWHWDTLGLVNPGQSDILQPFKIDIESIVKRAW